LARHHKNSLNKKSGETHDGNHLDEQEDWTNAILCSNGASIGVIGPDGKCKECGKLMKASLPEATASPHNSLLLRKKRLPLCRSGE
jgi:hypothetical protein